MTDANLKPLELEHKALFDRYFAADPPQVSELTFTNLFMWRQHYHPHWRECAGCLLIVLEPAAGRAMGLQPVGGGDKPAALEALSDLLAARRPAAAIERVGEAFVQRQVDPARYAAVPDRDNSDYVYATQDLIELAGRKYHRKKNHLHYFRKNYRYAYRALDPELVREMLQLQTDWCQVRECFASEGLAAEDAAVREALEHFEALAFRGGAVLVEGRVEAFALGELLNPETAVIHIEKANPAIQGLYAAVNQMFVAEAWSEVPFVNREQDLGLEGLRQAKASYYPHHMVTKYTLRRR